jgi:hypothetical protein
MGAIVFVFGLLLIDGAVVFDAYAIMIVDLMLLKKETERSI